jgi:hypothetical protein
MFAASGLALEEPRGRGSREAIMRKLLIGMVAGVVIGAGPAFAQTGASDRPNTQNPEATCPAGANCAPGQNTRPNTQNPEATCPAGANCAPGQASSSPAAPAPSRPASSEATGSPARPSSEQNPERTCPPGSRC